MPRTECFRFEYFDATGKQVSTRLEDITYSPDDGSDEPKWSDLAIKDYLTRDIEKRIEGFDEFELAKDDTILVRVTWLKVRSGSIISDVLGQSPIKVPYSPEVQRREQNKLVKQLTKDLPEEFKKFMIEEAEKTKCPVVELKQNKVDPFLTWLTAVFTSAFEKYNQDNSNTVAKLHNTDK